MPSTPMPRRAGRFRVRFWRLETGQRVSPQVEAGLRWCTLIALAVLVCGCATPRAESPRAYRLHYKNWGRVSAGGAPVASGLAVVEVDLPARRYRVAFEEARRPAPMVPHTAAYSQEQVQHAPWRRLPADRAAASGQATHAWLASDPPALYYGFTERFVGVEDAGVEFIEVSWDGTTVRSEFTRRRIGKPGPPAAWYRLFKQLKPLFAKPAGPQ